MCLGRPSSKEEDDPLPPNPPSDEMAIPRGPGAVGSRDVKPESKPQPAREGQLARYLVDNSLLRAKTRGLAYRGCKSLNVDAVAITNRSRKEEQVLVAWGEIVHGRDEGDGWLRVETQNGSEFLPMALQDKLVLILADAATNIYRVDNSILKAPTDGLAYRYARDVKKKECPAYDSVARWQTFVAGIEVDGSWLKVGEGRNSHFLPMSLDDKPVLVKWP